jgi:hypothetical protein
MSIAVAAAATVLGVFGGFHAFAGSAQAVGHKPPRDSAKATEAAQPKVANARQGNSGKWFAVASKQVAIQPALTVIASLSLPAGSFSVSAAGSLWTASGQAGQDVGCHLLVGNTSYGDGYVSLDAATLHQETFALVGLVAFKSQTTIELGCLLGSNPKDQVTTQANMVATKVG